MVGCLLQSSQIHMPGRRNRLHKSTILFEWKKDKKQKQLHQRSMDAAVQRGSTNGGLIRSIDEVPGWLDDNGENWLRWHSSRSVYLPYGLPVPQDCLSVGTVEGSFKQAQTHRLQLKIKAQRRVDDDVSTKSVQCSLFIKTSCFRSMIHKLPDRNVSMISLGNVAKFSAGTVLILVFVVVVVVVVLSTTCKRGILLRVDLYINCCIAKGEGESI